MKNNINRRTFIKNSLLVSGGILLAPNFISCSDIDDTLNPNDIPDNLEHQNFNEGVASFDPTSTQIIIWSRYTTSKNMEFIGWQLAEDSNFKTIVRSGKVITDALRDFTISIEIQGLMSGKKFFYRFIHLENGDVSATGETLTLPKNANEITFAVASCSNYASGLFNVYDAIAKSDADVVIHLGDYIYEYGKGEYGTNASTEALNRQPKPDNEIITLDDYRTRYKQYRNDKGLQLAHQKLPFICIWDDHEIANDTYTTGAENHNTNEGDFNARKQAALQAYSEYLPAKTNDINVIYRSFQIGTLANLVLLDTRLIGRNKQLEYKSYFDRGEFNSVKFQQDWLDTSRTLLGETQRNWLLGEIAGSNAKWQIVAQQVLMGKMFIPAELLSVLATILSEVGSSGEISPKTLQVFQTKLQELVSIKLRYQNNDPTLTNTEKARITTVLPYNLDAWDGYPVERSQVLKSFTGKNVIVLAGDTHNAWHNTLKNTNGDIIGQEFATASVTSPGFEGLLGSNPTTLEGFKQAIEILIDDLKYLDVSQRGFMKVTINQNGASSEWIYVDTILSETYNTSIGHSVSV